MEPWLIGNGLGGLGRVGAERLQAGDGAAENERVDVGGALVCIHCLEIHHVPNHI